MLMIPGAQNRLEHISSTECLYANCASKEREIKHLINKMLTWPVRYEMLWGVLSARVAYLTLAVPQSTA